MKTLQLATGDILTFDKDTEVLFDNYFSDTAIEELTGIEIEVQDTSSNGLLRVIVPAGTKLIAQETSSNISTREYSKVWFIVLEWPPKLIQKKHRVVIWVDVLNSIEFGNIETKPQKVIFEENCDIEETQTDDEDFSHIS